MTRHLSHVAAGLTMFLVLILAYSPARSDDASPALIAAAKSGDTATLNKLLAQGIDPNLHDETGISSLEWAAAKGHLAAVKALLNAHATVDGASTEEKYTPLMRAANFGHKDVVALLIANGADVNARTRSGYTPLDFAVLENHRDVVAFLKMHGAKHGAGAAGLAHPQALCDVGKSEGFYAKYLSWKPYDKQPSVYFCQGVKHDFPGGAGNTLMYTYEVDGIAGKAQRIVITTDIFAGSLPTDTIDQTLRPLLTAVYAAGGGGPLPSDLAGALAALSQVQQDTTLGAVTATYRSGSQPEYPYNGAEYTIEITLH